MRACGDTTSWRCWLVAVILVAMWAWGRPVVALAQAEIPPEVRQALESNTRAFAPIALTLEKQRTAPEQPTELTKWLLGVFPGFLKPLTYEYLSQDGRCYARYNHWIGHTSMVPGPNRGKTEMAPEWQELAWDGKSIYRGGESLEPKILSIVPIEKVDTDPEIRISTWYDVDDYFRMTGILPPRAMKELPQGPQSEILRLLERDGRVTGTRTEPLAGGTAQHFVLELQSGDQKHRFWLDPALGYAVRRHEAWAASGALAFIIDNSDFVKLTGPELWLPRHCHADWHTWPELSNDHTRDTTMVVDIQATRLERAHVPPEKFAIKYDKPGSLVSDARLAGAEKGRDGRIDYLVPADPRNLEQAIRAAQEKSGYVPPRRPLFVWIIGGSIALGVIAGAIVLVRWRRGRSTTP
jgi:hypothetical protein